MKAELVNIPGKGICILIRVKPLRTRRKVDGN
jgi:hypothetical protein